MAELQTGSDRYRRSAWFVSPCCCRRTKERWLSAAPEHKRGDLIPDGWFEQWVNATLASDPGSLTDHPEHIRATNGPILDIREYWTAGKAFYDPKNITVPVLLIHAEWDIDVPLELAQNFFTS